MTKLKQYILGPSGYFLLGCAAMGLLWTPILISIVRGSERISHYSETRSPAASAVEVMPVAEFAPTGPTIDDLAHDTLEDLTWKSRLTP
ncbi:hypothetical protein ACK8OR_06780 [Jannaschia sp. KMU-145]|uniref:hypothetical protein n=1 Tax=Jannaschia halovivens TaxID=3388667 RepID=UPI00396B48A4